MPMTATTRHYDPLGKFRVGAFAGRGGHERPIPLVSTRIDVTIRGGLALVAIERAFRNGESQPIEATMTFPVPIDATLCALSVTIDKRTLHAVTQARDAARQSYEDAIDAGHAAVLHEELLAGIHMLSIGPVGPDGEIVVAATWTAPLWFAGDGPRLRIPMTAGEIYGRSPLADADDLVTGTHDHKATIGIVCEDGMATLIGASAAVDGRYHVKLDAPIDIAIAGWAARQLDGISADGRRVTMTIDPAPGVDDRLDIDLLLDRSGSMGEPAIGQREIAATKFDVARVGLATMARRQLAPADRIRLWQFNDRIECVGEASGADFETLLGALDHPDGGTEIGLAVDQLIANSRSRNLVIVTDGQSWALDPQRVARAGMRVTAVLIGEDALEGAVATIAAMTGGQVHVAAGSDATAAIAAACESARMPHRPPQTIAELPERIAVFRRGARIVAIWGDKADGVPTTEARLIGATAAMLAIPLMRDAVASALAEREGVACHLTRLVLVDVAGERQASLPATRKIALATPRTTYAETMMAADRSAQRSGAASPVHRLGSNDNATAAYGGAVSPNRIVAASHAEWSDSPRAQARREVDEVLREMDDALAHEATLAHPMPRAGVEGLYANPTARRRVDLPSLINLLLGAAASDGGATDLGNVRGLADNRPAVPVAPVVVDLKRALGRVDWDEEPEALRQGRTDHLADDVVDLIRRAARVPTIAALARTWGIDVIAAIIGLLAEAEARSSRSAARLARSILDEAVAGEVAIAMREVGL